MIVEYHRPESLEDAWRCWRERSADVPMGGGTVLSRQQKEDVAVVDLQRWVEPDPA
jgi:CO/xanthine dehydrogenase FAD-binding subunit